MPRSRALAAILLCLSLLAIAGRSHAQGCEPGWAQDQFCFPGIDGTAYASCVYDDGTGEALYVGGEFDIAGCRLGLNNIVKWDGHTWSPLTGSGGTGIDGTVRAMAVYDDGSGPALYVGGEFTTAGGLTANNIAKWDGSEWSALAGASGTGTDDYVWTITTFDDGTGPALYIGGEFTTAGGVTTNHIASWNGSEWATLQGANGIGTDLGVAALISHDDGSGPSLFVGGGFQTAGGITVHHIARWDGVEWHPIIADDVVGTKDSVLCFCVYDDGSGPVLFASGHFRYAGGVFANFIAKWDGTKWSPLIDSISGANGISVSTRESIQSMAVYDDGSGGSLYFNQIRYTTSTAPRGVGRWDGSSWSFVPSSGQNTIGNGAYSLTVFDDKNGAKLYALGTFTVDSGSGFAPSSGISCWDGIKWNAIQDSGLTTGLGHGPNGIRLIDDDDVIGLCVFGSMRIIDDFRADGRARWDGEAWSLHLQHQGSWGAGIYDQVLYSRMDTVPSIYAAGSFNSSATGDRAKVASWDGFEWTPLIGTSGEDIFGYVYDLELYDGGTGLALYACGMFDSAGGQQVNHIAKWTGTDWVPLEGAGGVGLVANLGAYALEVFDDGAGPSRYVGGTFTSAGGIPASYIARWDGSEWHALEGPNGQGVNGFVNELVTYDDGSGPVLLAGGWFSAAGGIPASRLAKWDGSEWSPLVDEPDQDLNGVVNAIYVDESAPNGPVFYVGGTFTTIGQMEVNHVAKWDGEWSAFSGPNGVGVNDEVTDIELFDDGSGPALYVIGDFSTAGGTVSAHIAKYDLCASPACLPDTNHDGTLSPADFTAWIAAFNAMSPTCDQNSDGSCTPADFTAWISNYNAGCP